MTIIVQNYIMKFHLAVIFSCVLYLTSNAQNHFHVYGGINVRDFRFPNNPYDFNELYNPGIGAHIGLLTEIPLSQKLFLRPQLQFIQRGSHFENVNTNTEATTNLIYTELPILLGYHIGKPFSLAIGPSIGYMLYGYIRFEGANKELKNFPENDFDFGVSSTFGWKPFERWTFLITSYYGITAIHAYEVFNTQTYDVMPVSFANVSLQLSAAYEFPSKEPNVRMPKTRVKEK